MSSTDNEAPALAPPDGLSSDFGHPDSLQRWSNLCISVCLSMSTIVFLLRTYVRVAIKRQWMLEDCKSFFIARASTPLLTFLKGWSVSLG